MLYEHLVEYDAKRQRTRVELVLERDDIKIHKISFEVDQATAYAFRIERGSVDSAYQSAVTEPYYSLVYAAAELTAVGHTQFDVELTLKEILNA